MTAAGITDSLDQKVRRYVYDHFVERERPPTVAETAAHLNMALDEAKAAYKRLDQNHAFFLEPGSYEVRMANPLSAIPTQFRVHAKGRSWWANCAWDTLGTAAMLHSDAEVVSVYADSRQPLAFAVEDGHVPGRVGVVHFAVPFSRWYDDLILT